MSKTPDSHSPNRVEEAIVELVSTDETLTNAEIAREVDTQVSTVRDIRLKRETRESRPADSETQTDPDTPVDPDTETPAAPDTTAAPDTDQPQPAASSRLQRVEDDSGELLAALQDPVVKVEYTDGEPIVRSVNQEFVETFGYPASEIVGESLHNYIVPDGYGDPVSHPDDRTVYETRHSRAVTRQTSRGVREFLYREVQETNGECVFKLYTEITGEKRREVKLNRQIQRLKGENRRLENKSQQLEQFASILSHDLRNPINIAEGYLGQIATEENEAEVAVIERALDRMNSLIDDTLTLKDQSQPAEALERQSVAELAEAAWELVETGDSELRITDQFELACDDDRIARLFENVFRNAIEHNDEPVVIRIGIHDTLTTSTRGDTKKAFHVSDDGCGIPEDKREQMFEIGETTTREGTGLGLPIIKRIGEAHHWSVQVVESFDGGAKFVFTNVDID